jgi:hypothetical protein
MNFLRKIFLVAALFVLPSTAFAGPGITWANTPMLDGESFIGYLNVTGIDQTTPPLMVLLFADSDPEFNPYVSYANLGPAQNGLMTFNAPVNSSLIYYLPVLVDQSFFSTQPLNPFSGNAGQVANINFNNGGTGNPPTDTGNGNGVGNQSGDGNQTQNPNPTGADSSSGAINGWPTQLIDNPLQVTNLNNFIANLLNAFLKIAIPILAVFLIYAGMKFVMARGNEKELQTAKDNLLWVVIGGAILLGAWTIVRILKGTVEEIDISLINSLVNYFV